MAKGMYIGVGDKARKVKKAYIGIDGKARKIKKMYIGIDGKARLFYSGSGEIKRYGMGTALDKAVYGLASTSHGDYALFVGGASSSYNFEYTTYAYNQSLTKSKPSTVNSAVQDAAGASVGNYAIFTGGWYMSSYDYTPYCSQSSSAYDLSLTRSSANAISIARGELSATTIGSYALFGGGRGWASGSYTSLSNVDAFNTSLTYSGPYYLRNGAQNNAAATVGGYALFAGGINGASSSKYITTFNASLTRGEATDMSYGRNGHVGVSNGTYALFAGGASSGGWVKTVDVYNASLTKSTVELPNGDTNMCSTPLGTWMLICGGQNYACVYAFDDSLTLKTMSDMSAAKYHAAAAYAGNYALIAAGYAKGGSITNTVDVYQLV